MSAPAPRPIRLAVLDDAAYVRGGDGLTRPRAGFFHRFAESVVARGPFDEARFLIPLATDGPPSVLPPVDESLLRIVPTAPFEGIAGYLRGAARIVPDNGRVLREALEGVDLLWLKVPASNAPLAALAARRARVPRFTYVVGSVRGVVRAQDRRGAAGLAAALTAVAYDGVSRILARTGPSLALGAELFTSLVSDAEIAESRLDAAGRRARVPARAPTLAWAGRVAGEKGLEDLVDTVAALARGGLAVRLRLLGEGPHRPLIEARARAAGVEAALQWTGLIGDRTAYMAALRDADLFVFPSRSEGVPKAVVDAMAAGLPVVAARVGGIPALVGTERGILVPPRRPDAIAAAVRALLADGPRRLRLRAEALEWVAERTTEREADRLVRRFRAAFPDLPWPEGEAG